MINLILFLFLSQTPPCGLAATGAVQCFAAIRLTNDSVGLGPPANYKVSQVWQIWPAGKLLGFIPTPAGSLLLTPTQWSQNPTTGAITINAGLKHHKVDTFVTQGVWQ
jgi:hypothetical protein